MNIFKLDIVVVNWNSGEMLFQCVQSIQKAWPESVEGQVIIVDNGSSDGSLASLEPFTNGPFKLEIICNAENRGFGAACNQGAARGDAEYLLFLNPDTRLFESSLSVPLDFMSNPENASVGIAGIQLVDEQNLIARSCARFPTPMIFFAQALGLNYLPGLGELNTHMNEWPHDVTRTVDHVIGAFYLIRRSLFNALGGFDERFFVYLEDLDLSLRARQAGWRSVYLAEAQAFHAGGGTSRQVKAQRLFYSLRSRLLYGFKHFKRWQAWALLAVTLVLEPVTRSVFSLVRGGVGDLRNTLRAYAMLYADLPSILSAGRLKR
jgi:hypothetical protein